MEKEIHCDNCDADFIVSDYDSIYKPAACVFCGAADIVYEEDEIGEET